MLDPSWNRSFGYDDLRRLTSAGSGASLWGTATYAYDVAGNMTASTIGTRTNAFTYTGTTSKISTATENGVSMSMQYDEAGNESKGAPGAPADEREYSCRNLLAQVTGDPGVATYVYDGRGVRVHTGGDAAPPYDSIYTPELNLSFRVDADGVVTHSFLWLNGHPVIRVVPATGWMSRSTATTSIRHTPTIGPASIPQPSVRYVITDHLGTPVMETDDDAMSVWRAEYEPYGNIYTMRAGARTDQPLRLPGQEAVWQSPSGAEENYNIHRWYRSGWGRYTQADPLGLAGSRNMYAYAGDDPINLVDRDGLKTHPVNFVGPLQPGDTRTYAANMNDPEIEAITLGFQATRSFYPAGTRANLQGECVSLTKFFSRVPCTSCWRAGVPVMGNNVFPGTAVATFVNGRYPQEDVPKNSGIFVQYIPNGFKIIDQWPGHYGMVRDLYVDPTQSRSNRADTYSVITAPAGECGCSTK